jgi:SAM-dependent methyltransferase
VSKDKIGIEVGPWHGPIAPKQQGYRCLVLDVFDTDTLRARAKGDPFIHPEALARIEDVDLLGSSTEIGDLVEAKGLSAQIDYIVSSHNFEHLPNPIRFLQGCERALKPGGVLTMAIPDRRTCYDYFRPHTTLAAWLEPYFAGRDRPTFRQVFEHNSLHSLYHRDGQQFLTFGLLDDPAAMVPLRTLQEAFDAWKQRLQVQDQNYYDAHCSTFTPASFELLVSDLFFLGLTRLELIEISGTDDFEFYVHLRKPADDTVRSLERDQFYEKRQSLLQRVNSEAGVNSLEAYRMRSELSEAHAKISKQQNEVEAARKQAEQIASESERRINELLAVVESLQTSRTPRTSLVRSVVSRLRG